MQTSFRHRDARPLRYRDLAVLAAMCWCTGCAGRSLTADNPVVARVPPRVAAAQNSELDTQTAQRDIAQVAFDDKAGPPPLDSQMLEVAATVDGTPILVSDVLEPHAMNLAAAQQQLPEAKFLELREQLIRRELPRYIEETALMNAALAKLDQDKRAQLEQQLDDFFTLKLQDIQKQTGAGTLAELEARMQAQGTTLSNLRRAFGRQQLAAQSLQLHLPQQPAVTRGELLAEYERRIAEYTQPAQVKWQQIWISYDKHGGKKGALAVVDQAIAELKSGSDFSSVAGKYSDGVMAKDGGNWDWTQKGSLANAEVERLLFELRVGEIGQVIAGDKAFQIVRVTERRPDRVTPFEEVQDQLRKDLTAEKQNKLRDDVVKQLRKNAVITTMFDAS
ncbi:MAG: peptidyl-prolyl cis-trans isomerase [Planctomycetaceae bacterium]